MARPPIRLGLIGAGAWGRNLIATATRLDGVTLARVASSNPDTAKLLGPECKLETDWRAVATASDLDGVMIATPPSLHAEMATVALEAGKAVFVEKPVTLDPGEARALLTTAERCARPVLVDHIHLFSPAWQALKHRALAGPGRLRSIGSAGGNRGPVRPDTPALWDYGPHDVAMCLDLIGEKPRAVSATLETRLETGAGAAETILLRLSFADGVEAEILVGNAVETKQRRFTARFDGATMTYDDLAPDKLVIETGTGDAAGLDRNVEAVALPDTPPLDLALERFARAIAANDTGLESLRLAVAVVEVLAEADRALQRN